LCDRSSTPRARATRSTARSWRGCWRATISETAGRYANVAAALSTTGYGAVTPIPRKAQVMAVLKRG
jgi:sugar/nucleoside kinase (ribokinase family)